MNNCEICLQKFFPSKYFKSDQGHLIFSITTQCMLINKTKADSQYIVKYSGGVYSHLNVTILIFITLKPRLASSGEENHCHLDNNSC